jgi:hypothetical protein
MLWRYQSEVLAKYTQTMWELFMARFTPPAGFTSARRSYVEVENEADEKKVFVSVV